MTSTRTAAVLFDLDGTLVDTEPLYYEATRRLLDRHGVRDFTWEQHAGFIGVGTRETLEVLAGRFALTTPVDELLADLNAVYLGLLRSSAEVFPRMRTFVERLHANGVPMAVASGSSREAIEAALVHAGLQGYFGATASAEEVAAGKPEPDVFLEAARRLGVPAARCAVIEDSAPGVAAAHAAGMRCLAVLSVPVGPGTPPPAAFGTAELVFPGGHAEFTAEAAYDWLEAAGAPRP
ncbi:HAD family hydrolase [Streptomyces fuscigenes]|uniref:HAD family hydrolase n=1 Tax=Streptomyces fuscigenes TaxID=1528880 RepID=UPI001F3D55CF|nr:HAD family phosphatase [Streptomyces fuscigenes]MCF3963523.1 HAD family phosphatase [Streptomyces fuscigenes]